MDSGHGSFLPDVPKGEKLKPLLLLYRPDFTKADLLLDPAFRQLRTEADAWHAERVAFMLRRLDAGRHPDTDSSFWEGYTAPAAPELPTISVPDAYDAWQARRTKLVLLVIIGVPMLLSGLAASWWIVRATRARSA